MERHFDVELKELKDLLLKMAALTETAIHRSIEALRTQDKKLADTVIKEDRFIDELELEIDEKSINLLALKQPMGMDLRFIMTGMKINTELERIADLAVNISQRAKSIADQPLLKPLVDIPKLSVIAQSMVRNSIEAFVEQNEKIAKSVILADSDADKLRNIIYDEVVNDFIVKDGTCAPRAIPLLLVSRHLERICDHATYIAEDVIYMIEAKIVKHHPEKL